MSIVSIPELFVLKLGAGAGQTNGQRDKRMDRWGTVRNAAS